MVLVLRSGLMGLATKDNGRITELMVMENLCMLMETSMKETGLMIKLTASESISMLTVQGMKEIGEMTSSMARARRHGQMALYMRVSTWLARSTGSVFTVGMMVLAMKENGTRTRSEVMEHTPG